MEIRWARVSRRQVFCWRSAGVQRDNTVHNDTLVGNKRILTDLARILAECLQINQRSPATRPLLGLRLLLRKRPRVARPYYLNDNHTLNDKQLSKIINLLVPSVFYSQKKSASYLIIILLSSALKLCLKNSI